MAESKGTGNQHSPLKEVLYLVLCGLLFLGGILGWRHFHKDAKHPRTPEERERAQSLNDH